MKKFFVISGVLLIGSVVFYLFSGFMDTPIAWKPQPAPQPVELLQEFLEAIRDNETMSLEQEEYFLGPNGGLLGLSIYESLEIGYLNSIGFFIRDDSRLTDSLIGKLLFLKLKPLLKDRNGFLYHYSPESFSYSQEQGLTKRKLVTVSVRIYGPELLRWNGFSMVFNFHGAEGREGYFIDLSGSTIGNETLHSFLGFSGEYPSALKLSQESLQDLFPEFCE